jgi:nitrogen regulatory protein PII
MNHQTQQTTMPPHSRTSLQTHVTKIELFVQPAKLDDLKEELVQWTTSLVWSEVNYYLGEKQVVGVYRGSEYVVDSAAMIKVEAVVPTRAVGAVVAAIERVLPPASVRGRVFAVISGEDLVSSTASTRLDLSELTGPH